MTKLPEDIMSTIRLIHKIIPSADFKIVVNKKIFKNFNLK